MRTPLAWYRARVDAALDRSDPFGPGAAERRRDRQEASEAAYEAWTASPAAQRARAREQANRRDRDRVVKTSPDWVAAVLWFTPARSRNGR